MDCSRKYVSFEEFIMCGPTAQVAADVLGTSTLSFFYVFLFVKQNTTCKRYGIKTLGIGW